jgi:hypothetical protein
LNPVDVDLFYIYILIIIPPVNVRKRVERFWLLGQLVISYLESYPRKIVGYVFSKLVLVTIRLVFIVIL